MESYPDILDSLPPHLPPPEPASAPPPPPPPARPQRLWLHVVLFVASFISAMWFQSIDWSAGLSWREQLATPLHEPALLRDGFVFAVALLTILLAHEMGHYLTARRYGVDQSLPYFIPAPTLFGTLGAVILMRSQPANRSVLLRVAAAGPIAGLLVAIPACIWGLAHSTPVASVPVGSGPIIGSSLLWQVLVHYFAPPVEVAINLHPVAFAGWAGLLVTGLNLIPAAQLDGGHIAYALLGRRHAQLSFAIAVTLLGMGVLFNPTGAGAVWIVWSLLLFIVGMRHPPVRNEAARLSRGERATGWLALVLFVVTFVPVPLVQDLGGRQDGPGLEQQDESQAPPGDNQPEREDRPAPKSGEAEEYRL